MAFLGIILVYAFIFLVVIGIATLIGAILFLVAGLIALDARGKAKRVGRMYQCPASVLVLRIIGTVFLSPILTVLGILLLEQIDNVVHPDTSSGYEEDYYDDDWDEGAAYEINSTENAVVWIENYI